MRTGRLSTRVEVRGTTVRFCFASAILARLNHARTDEPYIPDWDEPDYKTAGFGEAAVSMPLVPQIDLEEWLKEDELARKAYKAELDPEIEKPLGASAFVCFACLEADFLRIDRLARGRLAATTLSPPETPASRRQVEQRREVVVEGAFRSSRSDRQGPYGRCLARQATFFDSSPTRTFD